MSRPWTQKEVQAQFLTHMRDLVHYWEKETSAESLHDRLNGLMFSVLATLDGCSTSFPACEVIPCPHETDAAYHRATGGNYYAPFKAPDDAVTVHGSDMLHDLWQWHK